MRDITICLTYFKSLTLANLNAALHSLRQQDLYRVQELIVVDNDTIDDTSSIEALVASFKFPIETRVISVKHHDATKTHAWSTNLAVLASATPWVLFTRADYILDFFTLRTFTHVIDSKPEDWRGFVTGHVYHLTPDVSACDDTPWRLTGTSALRALPGVENDYTAIDAGVWLAHRAGFDAVNGLDEALTAWGHAQTHFQWKLFCAGVEFVRLPEIVFCHPQHAAVRDLTEAHRQLASIGVNLHELWTRYEGAKPY